MPRRPKAPCGQPGCPRLVEPGIGGRCPEHRKAYRRELSRDYDRARGTPTERGYGVNHQRLRGMVLREEPLCRHCLREGSLTPSTDMDHIDGNQWNLERDNLQGLCKSCHAIKTRKEQGGGWGSRPGRGE